MDYFLGVDIGNTKSHALIADENGRALGLGQAGPGSWEAVGWEDAQTVLNQITDQALAQAGINKEEVRGAGFGLAGYDWPEDCPGHKQLIESLGLTNAAYAFDNDTLVGLVAGAREGWGIVVVAGTSNNCRGRDRYGRTGRVTGSGTYFGEYGGANEVVTRAVQAVAAAWTKRGPHTYLEEALVQAAGAEDVSDLLAGLIRGRYSLKPAHAPIVFAAAKQDDAVAQEIITWAGRELGRLANGVIRQLNFEQETFDVVLSGSLYKGGALLTNPMREEIHALAPGAQLVPLTAPPVIGGVLWGMEQVGLNTAVVRPRLIETSNQILLEA